MNSDCDIAGIDWGGDGARAGLPRNSECDGTLKGGTNDSGERLASNPPGEVGKSGCMGRGEDVSDSPDSCEAVRVLRFLGIGRDQAGLLDDGTSGCGASKGIPVTITDI
jgi:hypothetical protein